MNSNLAKKITDLFERDENLRNKLIKNSTLGDGYNPEMQSIHEENALALFILIKKHGWPNSKLVGEKASKAAWIIVQHAISLPDFQRQCLEYLKEAADQGKIPLYQPAMLQDRILVFEGKKQIYGTQFDWDDNGDLVPYPISNIETVDERREGVGLKPLAQAIEEHRLNNKNIAKPKNPHKKRQEAEAWAKKVGWRS